jgi:hydrogenase maturation protein HypF
MVTDETEAETKLTGIAEGFLHHDRPIDRPIDDSVLRPVAGVARIARSGRGLAPMEFRLPFALGRPVLACGGQTKSTIALGWGKQAVLSPHLGDLDNPAALAAFARMAEDLQALYNMRAEQLVTDAHPNYASTVWASEQGLPVASVWHHHAHASALAGESGETGELLVFTWDAVGLGPDGLLWGGEALLGSPGCWRVAARLRRLKLQGGEAVARDPWRSGAAMCWQAGFEPPEGLVPDPVVFSAWIQALNCHESSAVGRLFDGAAALLGLCRRASYEGEAPARLEALAAAAPRAEAPGLPLAEQDGVLEADWTPLVPVLLDHRLTPAARAAWFHAALAATAIAIAERVGARRVGLSGGVFQNRRLAEAVLLGLRRRGIAPELGRRVPCNDAGLSFGQLVEFGAQRWKM